MKLNKKEKELISDFLIKEVRWYNNQLKTMKVERFINEFKKRRNFAEKLYKKINRKPL